MKVNNQLLKYLKTAVCLSGNMFFVTDLENVRIRMTKKYSNTDILPTSTEVKNKIKQFCENGKEYRPLLLHHQEVLPIYQDISFACNSQIILPIILDNKVQGAFIVAGLEQRLEEGDILFALTTVHFIEKMI